MSPQHVNRYPQPKTNHSMIFKIFDSKIDKWTSKIGIFGKSFNELGTGVNNAFKSVIDNLDNFDEDTGFWESLTNNLFPKKENIKSLEIAVPELIDTKKANEYIDIMKQIDSGTHNVFKTYQEWYDSLADGEKWIAKHGQETKGQIRNLEGVTQANQQARDSALAHNEAIKAQTFSAKAGQVALKALSIAGNMIAMWAISKGLELAVKEIDKLVHSAEYAEKAFKTATDNAKSLTEAIKNIHNDTVDMEKSIDSIINRYAELSQGVNTFTNENISLSTEQYEEFLELNRQLV